MLRMALFTEPLDLGQCRMRFGKQVNYFSTTLFNIFHESYDDAPMHISKFGPCMLCVCVCVCNCHKKCHLNHLGKPLLLKQSDKILENTGIKSWKTE